MTWVESIVAHVTYSACFGLGHLDNKGRSKTHIHSRRVARRSKTPKNWGFHLLALPCGDHDSQGYAYLPYLQPTGLNIDANALWLALDDLQSLSQVLPLLLV